MNLSVKNVRIKHDSNEKGEMAGLQLMKGTLGWQAQEGS